MTTKIEYLPVTGLSAIDGDRLRFTSYINEFKAANAIGDESKASEVLTEILDYIVSDFKIEEHIMKKRNYPAFGEHLRAHANFFVSLREAQSMGMREEVEFIERWFINHTILFDLELGQFLKGG